MNNELWCARELQVRHILRIESGIHFTSRSSNFSALDAECTCNWIWMHRIIQHVANCVQRGEFTNSDLCAQITANSYISLHLNTNTIAKCPLLCVLRSVAYHIHLNLLLKVHFTSSMLASPTRRILHTCCKQSGLRNRRCSFFFGFSSILRQLDCIRTAKDKRQTTACSLSAICIAVSQQIMRFSLTKRRTEDNSVTCVSTLCSGIYSKCDVIIIIITIYHAIAVTFDWQIYFRRKVLESHSALAACETESGLQIDWFRLSVGRNEVTTTS